MAATLEDSAKCVGVASVSQTSVYPSNRQWLRRLVSGQPHQIIPSADNPYLRRWYLIPRNPMLNVYLHQFLRSDDDRALHDHPWWFISLILRGKYDEITEAGTRRRRAGSIAYRPATWRHRVRLLDNWAGPEMPHTYGPPFPCWTLIVTGRRVRTWGFWCKYRLDEHPSAQPGAERFIKWDEFGDAGCGEFQ